MLHSSIRTSKGKDQAFTLVELLVVIAIIAVLASLLMSSLGQSKSQAKSVACKSNLKQFGIALASHVSDLGYFPVYNADPDSNFANVYWHESLQPYADHKWTNGLYRCPDYQGLTIEGNEIAVPLGSYGYNANGTKFGLSQLGLGGALSKLSIDEELANQIPFLRIKESMILNSSDMIALGDATLIWTTSFIIGLFYDIEVAEKESFNGMALIDINSRNAVQRDGWPGSKGVIRATKDRHSGNYNTVFVDGHVESIRREKLFEQSDMALRRWNNDHLPHADLIRKY